MTFEVHVYSYTHEKDLVVEIDGDCPDWELPEFGAGPDYSITDVHFYDHRFGKIDTDDIEMLHQLFDDEDEIAATLIGACCSPAEVADIKYLRGVECQKFDTAQDVVEHLMPSMKTHDDYVKNNLDWNGVLDDLDTDGNAHELLRKWLLITNRGD